MFQSHRVIAVDDDQRHLNGLVGGLHRSGVACLPIHFTGDTAGFKPCPNVRIIFADLNLIGQASDHASQFATLGGLIEGTIKPRGPYIVLLWTRYPEQAARLDEFLGQRLQDVSKPFVVLPLSKSDHLDVDGNVRDEGRLITAIVSLTRNQPQLGALFDWESRVLGAAGETVSALLVLASTQAPNARAEELGRVLSWLGIEAVGKEHLANNRFLSVNEALLPILADRVANLRSTPSEDGLWRDAVVSASTQRALTLDEAGRLNRMVHIDTGPPTGSERGRVIWLPRHFLQNFATSFGVDETVAAKRQFHCSGFSSGDDQFRWVLVQVQAACDYAQSHPGSVPCYLGLELPFPTRRRGTPPAALWTSPALELNAAVRQLRVSAQFPVSVGPAEFRNGSPLYRLRDQILQDLTYHVHSHGARPGMLSFHGR